MPDHYEIVTRWLDVALKRTTKSNYTRNSNVFADGDSLYSYGYHFEMARVLRAKNGKPRLFLLNGDTYSHTTSRHQSTVRSAINKEKLPSVIIPFSALDAAGIDRATIEQVDVLQDRTEVKEHKTTTFPEGARWNTYDLENYIDLTPEELEEQVNILHRDAIAHWENTQKFAAEEAARGDEKRTFWQEQARRNPEPPVRGTVEDLPLYKRRRWGKTGEQTVLQFGAHGRGHSIDVEKNDDGTTTYSWTTYRHWLGESLIRANVSVLGARSRKAYFLSGFDHQERRPLYFLCELPKGVKPTTVAEAYEDLKPQAVKLAETMKRPIVRQGDIFAIALKNLDKKTLRKQGARFEKRGRLLNTNHEATETAYLPDGTTLVRGVLYHNPGLRAADHARQKLTAGWNVVIKNTVPVAA